MDEQSKNTERTIKERSPETQQLVQYLRDAPDGALVSYDELLKVIGQSVRSGTPGYSFIQSAIRIVRNQYNKTFRNQRSDGYKHFISETEFLSLADSERKKISRGCSESIRRLGNAKLENFSKEGMANILAHSAIFHLQRMELKQKNIEKIMQATDGTTNIIPAQKTLQLLMERESS